MTTSPAWRLTLCHNSATVPPPQHYEYRIELLPGRGCVHYTPGYTMEKPPTWSREFGLTTADDSRLVSAMTAARLFCHNWHEVAAAPVGGALTWLEAEQGANYCSLPTHLPAADAALVAPLYDLIRSLVPTTLWEDLRQCRRAYLLER